MAGRDQDCEFCKALLEHGYVAPVKALALAPFMPIDDAALRSLRETIRRWAKELREASHDIPGT